jgi:CO/xanthine dehydrogenase Mo-binding subunit
MVFARVVRAPRDGAKLTALDDTAARSLPGVVAVIRDGDFLAIATEREEQAIAARNALASGARWSDDSILLPDMSNLSRELRQLRSETSVVGTAGQSEPVPPGAKRISAEYTRSYVSHGSIGPSCAVALLRDGHMTVWSHTQGVFPLRGDLAKVLGMQNSAVDVIHTPGSGCYGHNGADDVALDAALVARAVPGRPVKLQWMRDDEFAWAPLGPAMTMKVEAGLSPEGGIVDWSYDVWSNSHAMRPGQAGGVNLLAAWDLSVPFTKSPPPRIPQPFGDGDRNAVPPYELPRKEIRNHLLLDTPIRNGSFRTLGAHGNVFAIESFMDELAKKAGKDPVDFRRGMLGKNPRLLAALNLAAEKSNWGEPLPARVGRGVCVQPSFASFIATVVEAEVDELGEVRLRRVTCAVDTGIAVNPDTVRAQLEGGLIFGLTAALYGEITIDKGRVQQSNFHDYRMLRIDQAPKIEVHVIKSGEAPGGIGETGVTAGPPALRNAIYAATGVALRRLPIDRSLIAAGKKS